MADINALGWALKNSTDKNLHEIGDQIVRLIDLRGLLEALDEASSVEDIARALINDTEDEDLQSIGHDLWDKLYEPDWDEDFLAAREGLEFCLKAGQVLATVTDGSAASLVADAAKFIETLNAESLSTTAQLTLTLFRELDKSKTA